jgi:hypothetical protein
MKNWTNPAKRPASDETLNMKADFGQFTDLMKRIVTMPGKKKPIAPSSPAPAAS